MSANKGGLGRGLSSLISSSSGESQRNDESQFELPINLIEPNPEQPRTNVDENTIAELSASISLHGVLMPLIVRPRGGKYEIIAGERRWRAARLAGLEKVPVRIRSSSDIETLEIALIENLQREDLNAIEAAYGYRRLLDQHSMTQNDLAERISKSRSAIANTLRLLDLPEEIQQMLFDGKITAGHARAILSVSDEGSRIKLAEKVAESNLSVRETENLARLYASGEQPQPARAISPKSYKTIGRKLRKYLGAKVRVKLTKDKSKIEIEFENEEELQQLFDRITGAQAHYPLDDNAE